MSSKTHSIQNMNWVICIRLGVPNDHSYLYGSRASTVLFRDSPVYPHQNNEELKGLKMGKDDNLFCLHSNLLG